MKYLSPQGGIVGAELLIRCLDNGSDLQLGVDDDTGEGTGTKNSKGLCMTGADQDDIFPA